jgi:peptide/nickel transport system substrate-binding protein
MVRLATAILLGSALGGVALATEVRAQAQPADQITVAFDVSIAPSFLEPAETPGIGTPFVFLYALHDALIKPMPGNNMAPCLAESWKESPDGLTYEFKLREGLRFHNGDPFTAEDVKFSFHRYRGTAAKLLHERVKAVEIIDPHRVRFVLHAPWPDFLAFYATPATGAAWVVPKKHIERVGRRGVQEAPGRARALPVRAIERRCRAGAGGQRAVLAQEAVDQASRHQGHPRPDDAAGHAQDR